MSAKHIGLTAELIGLPPSCKLVLYGIANFTNPHGYARATNGELQQATGLSERAIRTNLRKLEASGFLIPLDDAASSWEWAWEKRS